MAATPAAAPAAAPRAPQPQAAPRPRPVDAATDEAVASILNFQLPSSAAFLRPQLRVRLRKVARHRYAPSSDPFGSRAITTSATTTVTQPLGQPRARSGVSPAVAYYRSLQGGPPDPAPPLDPALAALTLGYPAKDAREALQACRGGC